MTRIFAVLLLLAGLTASVLVFLIGAGVAAGAEFKEPLESVCYDPWLLAHPGDYEPDLDATWSWWPPGITCRHASGEVFVEPGASDAVAVGGFGLVVLSFGIVPTLLMTRLIWRLGRPRVPGAGTDA